MTTYRVAYWQGLAGITGIASLDTSDIDRLRSVLASLTAHS